MEVLFEHENTSFCIENSPETEHLSPILSYIKWKLDSSQWDDYNEFFHACHWLEDLKKRSDVWFDMHLMLKNGVQIGVLLILGGAIQQLEPKYRIEDENQSLLLKYFHLTDKGNGYGSLWLKSVILPYYQKKGFKRIYVNSSHKLSFPFYRRFGKAIAEYRQESDNKLQQIEGCFVIEL